MFKISNLFPHSCFSSTEPSLLGSGAYPFVATPEFPTTNGTVAAGVPAVPAAQAITPETWKAANPGAQSLMKEPPIAVANRTATTQFAPQGQQQVNKLNLSLVFL